MKKLFLLALCVPLFFGYKKGKSVTQWMPILYHFDSNDKINQVTHFLDRASINAAMLKP